MGHFEGIAGSETRQEFASRVYAAMASVLADDCDDVFIVSHGFTLTFVVSCWIGLPLDEAG